jgi:hypothetical protein
VVGLERIQSLEEGLGALAALGTLGGAGALAERPDAGLARPQPVGGRQLQRSIAAGTGRACPGAVLDGQHQPTHGVLALGALISAEELEAGILQNVLGVVRAGGVSLGLAAQRRSVSAEKLGEDAGAALRALSQFRPGRHTRRPHAQRATMRRSAIRAESGARSPPLAALPSGG